MLTDEIDPREKVMNTLMHNSHNFRLLNIWLGAAIEIVKSRLLTD